MLLERRDQAREDFGDGMCERLLLRPLLHRDWKCDGTFYEKVLKGFFFNYFYNGTLA